MSRRRFAVVPIVAVTTVFLVAFPGALRAGTRPTAAPPVAPSEPAQRQQQPKLLTVAARVCASYKDVTANLARNNIQESLQDLGADTLYSSGQPIDPDLESKGQPKCSPLPNWRFTFGTGIQGAVAGPWGSLSIVSNPFSTSIVTKTSTPLLNDQGQDTGKSLAGATTIALDSAQAGSGQLWIQGGTTSDPILNGQYPGQYGFAALRCAIDGLNGDNVERIDYPSGASHVFCYAYYVNPPPTSGTIVVRKEVSSPAGATQSFVFTGNISYTSDHTFALGVNNGAAASVTFFRAETRQGDDPWEFHETVPPGWFLDDIVCTSASGKSKATTDVGNASTSIVLASGDTVTCTYRDSQTPPAGGLSLTKRTLGAVGSFGYTVAPVGGGASVAATAKTTKEGVEVAATPETIDLAPGQYSISEKLPTSSGGTWKLTAVECDGAALPAASPVRVTIVSGKGVACRFENTFVPAGAITIHKKAYGNVGTAGFTIFPQAHSEQGVTYSKKAKVTKQGASVLATGDKTDALPLGKYKIQEFAAPGTNAAGWSIKAVECDGKVVGVSQGSVTVNLTASDPKVDCTFTNSFTPLGKPNPGPAPAPQRPGSPTDPTAPAKPGPPVPPTTTDPDPSPEAHLDVTKTADKSVVHVGDVVTYTIRVTNTGSVPANGVTVTEQTHVTNSRLVSIGLTQGGCDVKHFPASCSLGRIEPGQTVTIVAKLQATETGRMPNSVAVGAASLVVDPPTATVVRQVLSARKTQAGQAKQKQPKGASTPPPVTG